jgi:hypothetical protein
MQFFTTKIIRDIDNPYLSCCFRYSSMRDNTSYLTIAVAAGIFTATMVGLSIASYTLLKKRASDKKIRTRSTENDNEKYNPKYTTINGNHLTKTTEGLSATEEGTQASKIR